MLCLNIELLTNDPRHLVPKLKHTTIGKSGDDVLL